MVGNGQSNSPSSTHGLQLAEVVGHYTLVVMVGLALLGWLHYWSLLGFN